MAIDQNKITKLSKETSDQVIKLQKEFINDLYNIKRTMTLTEFIQFMQGLDVDKLVEQKAKNIALNYAKGQKSILLNKTAIGAITESTLNSLTLFNQSTFMHKLKTIGPEIRNQMINGLIGGLSEQQIVANVSANVGLLPHQTEAFVNTALNNYSRTITAQMADDLPPDTKFIYIGPVDEKTRNICLQMAGAGELTKAEIQSNYAGSFIDGGGVNCRHSWEEETAGKDLHFKKLANKRINDKKKLGAWETPQTFAESKQAII